VPRETWVFILRIIEIYTDAPERRRECLYFLAIGNFKIKNYSEARRFNDQLLKHEPRNDQAINLKLMIDEKVSTGKFCLNFILAIVETHIIYRYI
jgi:hypothetical protein